MPRSHTGAAAQSSQDILHGDSMEDRGGVTLRIPGLVPIPLNNCTKTRGQVAETLMPVNLENQQGNLQI